MGRGEGSQGLCSMHEPASFSHQFYNFCNSGLRCGWPINARPEVRTAPGTLLPLLKARKLSKNSVNFCEHHK